MTDRNEYQRAYYLAHREEKKAAQRAYRVANLDAVREREAARRASPEYQAEARRRSEEWRKKNPERLHESLLRYAEANRDKIREREAARGPEKHLYYINNKEKIRARNREWAEANHERIITYEHTYRAKKNGNGGTHTTEEWRDKCAEFGNRCAYCGESKKLERDHIIPISRGGSNDIDNIVPACRSCNARKHAKTDKEFRVVS